MEIKIATYDEIFSQYPEHRFDGFVVREALDGENLQETVETFMKISHRAGFISVENPWKSVFKVLRQDGKIDVCFVTEGTNDLNVLKWASLGDITINGIPLGRFFGWLGDYREAFQKKDKE